MPAETADSSPEILARVRECIARVTRYPLEVLTPEASLEDELGIDSVKLAEIAVVLGRELGLPSKALPRGPDAATIGGIARFATAQLAAQKLASNEPAIAPAPIAPIAPIVAAPAELAERVREVIARVTRYPLQVLTLQADLEDELGIDSVKQAEIAVVLMKELGLPKLSVKPGAVRTIGDVVLAIAKATASAAPSQEQAAPQPARSIVHNVSMPRPVRGRPLEGKVALVTGSGRGIGKTIAEHLANEGATVVVNSFHSREAGEATARAIVDAGGRALHLWGSVAQPEHLDAIFARIDGELGGLDYLVCNASDGFIGPFESIEPKHWDRAFRTNITGTYECARRAAPLMQKRGGGSIVTMSTITSQRYLQDFGCQGVVKAAVESLTRYLAFELAPLGVRANCVCAGPIYGDLINKFPNAAELIARWESMTPGGALCTAEDVALATAFLLGSSALRMTGTTLCVDNGASGQVDGRVKPLLPAARAASSLNGHAPRGGPQQADLARG